MRIAIVTFTLLSICIVTVGNLQAVTLFIDYPVLNSPHYLYESAVETKTFLGKPITEITDTTTLHCEAYPDLHGSIVHYTCRAFKNEPVEQFKFTTNALGTAMICTGLSGAAVTLSLLGRLMRSSAEFAFSCVNHGIKNSVAILIKDGSGYNIRNHLAGLTLLGLAGYGLGKLYLPRSSICNRILLDQLDIPELKNIHQFNQQNPGLKWILVKMEQDKQQS